MKIEIEDFFKPVKLSRTYHEEDYRNIEPLIEFAKSTSHLTYQSIYLIDYFKKGFLFVSDNPIFLCGKSSDDVLDNGYLHYFESVPMEDLQMLLEINIAGHEFYNTLAKEEKLNCYFSFDFHLKQPNGSPILINHKLKPILLDESLNTWIALCFVAISSRNKPGNVIFKNTLNKVQYYYDFNSKKWDKTKSIQLKRREKDILLYSAQGHTMEQIADRLFISIDTIKYYKRSIFSKLNVKSISEAITKSMELTLF